MISEYETDKNVVQTVHYCLRHDQQQRSCLLELNRTENLDRRKECDALVNKK